MVTRGGPPVGLPPALTQVMGEAPAPTTHCLAGSFRKPSAPVTLMLSVTAMGGGGRAGAGWGLDALLHALPDPFLRQTCCRPSTLPGAAPSRGFPLARVASAYHDHLFVPSGSGNEASPGGHSPTQDPTGELLFNVRRRRDSGAPTRGRLWTSGQTMQDSLPTALLHGPCLCQHLVSRLLSFPAWPWTLGWPRSWGGEGHREFLAGGGALRPCCTCPDVLTLQTQHPHSLFGSQCPTQGC